MTDEVVLTFEPPGRLLNLNDRDHWAERAGMVEEWRKMTYWYACKARRGGPAQRRLEEGLWEVHVVLPVRKVQRRDPHNFVATAKAIVDGLVDANYWPDDTPEYVTVTEPSLYRGDDVIVRINKREDPK